MRQRLSAKDLTISGIGIAAMIGGGYFIYQLGYLFPIPGMKYILMAPFMGAILYIITSLVKHRFSLLIIGTAFAGIMTIINIYMGIAILGTTLLSTAIQFIIPIRNKAFTGALVFPCFSTITALFISKYMIGGVFLKINDLWIVAAGVLCLVFGWGGVWLAGRMVRQLKAATSHMDQEEF